MSGEETSTEERLAAIAAAASEKKAVEPVALKIGEISSIADYFFICSGQNERQTKTIADAIEEKLKPMGSRPNHIEGKVSGSWILMDYGDIIVNIFMPESRDFYDIERLWGDCERVELDEAV